MKKLLFVLVLFLMSCTPYDDRRVKVLETNNIIVVRLHDLVQAGDTLVTDIDWRADVTDTARVVVLESK